MTKKDITKLVAFSYTKNKLDEKKVEKIAKLLSRKDLKAYARALSLEDKKHKVYIALPSKKLYNANEQMLKRMFAGKDILFEEDPTLLLGIRVLDNDMQYELSLADRVNKLTSGIINSY